MKPKGKVTAIDVEIGKRLRILRLARGMTQAALGDALGVTFQQIQKYERGANRISAGRLHTIAGVFDVPISTFFPESNAPPSTD